MSARDRGLPSRRKMRHDRHFVDELARRAGEGIGRMIPISSITSNADQPRSSLGDLSDLVASISVHGVLEPLLVRRRERGGYELVSGERRFHAALQAGLEEVPCIELEVEDRQALEIALIENLQRRDLSAFEEAEGFQTLVEKYGYTHEQVARAVGRSRVTVTETLTLLKIPQDLRDACRHADIRAKGLLLQIARAGSREEMESLIRRMVEDRLDRKALRELRQAEESPESSESDGKSTDEVAGERSGSPRGGAGRPLRLRIEDPDTSLRVSLSIRGLEADPESGKPDPERLISVLERLLERLRAQGMEALEGAARGKTGGQAGKAGEDR